MPVPKPNLYPDFNTTRLSHVCLNVADLSASRTFYTDIIGLQVTDEADGRVYLRAMEERGHHSVILQQSTEPGTVEVLGFKTFDEQDLDKAEAYFKTLGRPVQWVERAYQGRTLLTSDNLGIPLEFYHTMDRLAPIHQSYALYRGVKPLRIDHFNCFSPDVDASVVFYSDIGFRVTEYTEDEESKKLWAAWMHRKGGVHDMAFTNGTGPRMHHVALTVDPDLEPIKWDLQDPQRQTLWGAPAPKSWFENGSRFVGIDVSDSAIAASPIIAP